MARYKKIIIVAALLILGTGALLFNVGRLGALVDPAWLGVGGGGIPVFETGSIPQTQRNISDKINAAYEKIQGIVGAQLMDRTVEMFMNDLAYQVATELATGGEGGKPLFRTKSIGDSLQHAQEAAVGEFIGQLTQMGFQDLGINLCDPTLEVKLSLTLSLIDEQAPPRPTCDWQQVRKNWERFGDNFAPDLVRLQLNPASGTKSFNDYFKAFTLEESDLGALAKLQAELNNRKMAAVDVAKISASECQGFKDKATTITKEVKTHCRTLLTLSEAEWDQSVAAARAKIEARKQAATNKKLTDIVRDAANNFASTLTSKLMKRWIQGGMWSMFGRDQEGPSFREGLLAALRGGANINQPRGADIFVDFKSIKFDTLESFSLINDFVLCPDEAEFRKPDNCVMSTDLLQAVNNKMTVREAVEGGVLNGALQFINRTDALRNSSKECYREAFCYNNLVKLRKANIIPVGWEMATDRSNVVTPVTLRQAMDCFEDDTEKCPFPVDSAYAVAGVPHNPYYHLVDPNWVLKAPGAYCAAYVYSPVLESPDSSDRQQYCADAKVCLREDDDGNCLDGQYGYCTKSENIWRFNGDQCQQGDIYSGCLTFSNPTIGSESYLEQTLSYCTFDQVGCKRYSQEKNNDGNFVLQSIESDDNDLFLNRQSQECPSSEAGCHEYIVMAADTGANLFANGDFEIDSDGDLLPDGYAIMSSVPPLPPFGPYLVVNEGVDGSNAALSRIGVGNACRRISVLPQTLYNFSASFKQSTTATQSEILLQACTSIDGYAGNISSPDGSFTVFNDVAGLDPNKGYVRLDPADYDNISYTRINGTINTGNSVSCWICAGGIGDFQYVDDIKVEIISTADRVASPFSTYGAGAKITMNDQRFMCLASEVGCQGYTPANGDPMIPAVIGQQDLCPAECVGYASFAQTPNIFDNMEGNNDTEYYNFIPKTAKTCPSQAIGCEEFTNLDEVARGGEGKEYYSYLRQCVAESLGTTYYTWEGSDTAGYQIRTWQILESNITETVASHNNQPAPCTNLTLTPNVACVDISGGAVDNIARCGVETVDPNDDPSNNPNCRQFFDTAGNSFYRLQDRVIFASSDCHDYRRSATGTLYQAIPSLSTACDAQYNGCHSYTGNTANNVREIFANNFEQGTYAPWTFTGSPTMDVSPESLENGGHSLKVVKDQPAVWIQHPLSNISIGRNTYQLSWWMRNDNTVTVYALLNSNNPGGQFLHELNDSQLTNIPGGNWRYYNLIYSVDTTNFDPASTILRFMINSNMGGDTVYFDNITLREVNDTISAVKNSWQTPVACDNPYVGYHLGCQTYTDTNSKQFNIKSFSNLCRVDAIGCMAVIDTQNSSNPFSQTFNSGNFSQITVPEDNIDYLVPDTSKYCASEYKGCQELGLPNRENPYLLESVYKINNPDQYSVSLCAAEGVGCEEFTSSKGNYYFSDPGSATCTYKENLTIDENQYTGWFKTATIKTENPIGCSDSNDIFEVADLELNDCVWATATTTVAGVPQALTGYYKRNSLLTTNPTGCWPDADGILDGDDLQVDNLAATCPAEKNLCTTFKDPSDPQGCDPNIDGRVFEGVCFDADDGSVLDYDAGITCESNGGVWHVPCKDYYYYKNDKIDEKTCAGQVDKNGGCILLYDANNWKADHSAVNLTYDSNKTYDENLAKALAVSPIACDPSFDASCNLDANLLVKVKKDRQCSEWLACRSSTAVWDRDNNKYKTVCDDLGACIEYDRNNNITKCKKWAPANPVLSPLTISSYQNRDTGVNNHLQWSDQEYTGYSVPNILPIKDLTVQNFGPFNQSRLTFRYYDATRPAGNYFSTCGTAAGLNYDDRPCLVRTNTDGIDNSFVGECKSGYCWLNPEANSVATSTFGLEIRGYASVDAPFPNSIYPEDSLGNVLPAYRGANVCLPDGREEPVSTTNGCELAIGNSPSYKKISYGATDVRYYPGNLGAYPRGICTSGNTSRYECVRNTDCNSASDPGQDLISDGICQKATKIENFTNWSGICMDYDYGSRLVNDTGGTYYCNQWYPTEHISGTNSLYENYQEAGYYNPAGRDALFCAVSEAYQLPEDRIYCGSSVNINSFWYCTSLIKVASSTKVILGAMNEYGTALNSAYLRTDRYRPYSPDEPAVDTYGRENPANGSDCTDPTRQQYCGTFNQGLGVHWIEKLGAAPLFAGAGGAWDNNYPSPMDISAGVETPGNESLFSASDFDGDGSLGLGMTSQIPLVSLNRLSEIFDAPGQAIEVYYYDTKILSTGAVSWRGAVILPNENPDTRRPSYTYKEYGEMGTEDRVYIRLKQCMPGYHESWFNGYLSGWWGSPRGWNGSEHKFQDRWCSPMSHGIYIKPMDPDGAATCSQTNCSPGLTPVKGLQCLSAGSPYSGILSVANEADCAGDPNCEYKYCMEHLNITPHIEAGGTVAAWCSDFGTIIKTSLDVEYDCPGTGDQDINYENISSISPCLDRLYTATSTPVPTSVTVSSRLGGTYTCTQNNGNLIYNALVIKPGVQQALLDQINGGCFQSTVPAGCYQGGFYDYGLNNGDSFLAETVGTPCTGLACYQQCRIVTQLDAGGDLSWVRTDLWWRHSSENSPSSPLNNRQAPSWQSWYYSLASSESYIRNYNVNYGGIKNETTFSPFTHFGAATEYFDYAKPVTTRVPLSQNYYNSQMASTFFSSSNWATAAPQMSYLFARAYNLLWTEGHYFHDNYYLTTDPRRTVTTEDDTMDIDNLVTNINTFAGNDYDPRILKVCGNKPCEVKNPDTGEIVGYQGGITVNEFQNGDIEAEESLFAAVKLYFYAHPDHMPISRVDIDWGDGSMSSSPGRYKNSLPDCNPDANMPNICANASSCTQAGLQGFGGLDRACREGYKIFYHDYQYSGDYPCDGTDGRPLDFTKACYQPKVFVVDRWGQGARSTVAPVYDGTSYDDWIVVSQ